ncbi:hypothetical protein LCGC14_0888560 [marine sediment metagenome]|uniref:Uncharacterized protein n=1 Tax=marine sediment metagenome TaxID=412755 RepID=A0A0F9S6Y2_9ZZZZ
MWQKLVMLLLPIILKSISPALRDFLIETLEQAAARAELTTTLWDDVVIKVLRALLLGNTD